MANNYSFKDATAATLTAKSTETASVQVPHVNVDTLPALGAGTNNIGDVDVLTLPALPAGTNNIGDVDILSIAAGDNNIGNVDVLTVNGVAPAFNTGVRGATVQRVTIATDDSLPVTNAGTFAVQIAANSAVNVAQVNGVTPLMGNGVTGTGSPRVTLVSDGTAISTAGFISVKTDQTTHGTTDQVAADLTKVAGAAVLTGGVAGSQSVGGTVATNVAITANPINNGAQAVSSENAAVTTARQVQLVADLVGKLIVLPYANPENFVKGTTAAMTATTTTSLIAAPGAGLRNYITQITVSNAHATVGTDVVIQDGSGGATLYTIPAAAAYGGAVLTFPTRIRQDTANTALFCANVTTGASTKVSASGYKGA